jgi:isopentenyl-diphosphate delta-isomerase
VSTLLSKISSVRQHREVLPVSEQVILVSEDGAPVGTADKSTVHHAHTPLHLAFSCYIFDDAGRLLVTQRASHKITWPGVWTNSCCGHPAPGEALEDSVLRRVEQELGLSLGKIDLVLPRFRYTARMADGTVENELCPVFRAQTTAAVAANPAEVDGVEWIPWAEFAGDVLSGKRAVSPWATEQIPQLLALGAEPFDWPVASLAELPEAARV